MSKTATDKAARKANETADAMATAAFELPETIREMAEKGLGQSREAYDKLKGAAEETATLMEDQAQLVADNTSAMNMKAIDFAEANVKSAFDFARKLMASKDLSEAVDLQVAFARSQVETINGQAKEFGELTRKASTEALKPYKEQFDKTVNEIKSSLPN